MSSHKQSKLLSHRDKRSLVFKGAAGPARGHSSQPGSAPLTGAALRACAAPGCAGTGRPMSTLHPPRFLNGFYSSCPQLQLSLVLVSAVSWQLCPHLCYLNSSSLSAHLADALCAEAMEMGISPDTCTAFCGRVPLLWCEGGEWSRW